MSRSDFLFARPSFIGGMASVLDLGATMVVYNEVATPERADVRAVRSDWEVCGNDLRAAIDQWENQRNEER